MSRKIKLLYMNSFSRSGETLMLRTLNEHKNISVLHQLKKLDEEIELQYDIFKKIKKLRPDTLELSDSEVLALGISKEVNILVVKNSIFLFQKQKYSFMLVRNPYSAYASYKKMADTFSDPKEQMRRWAKNIDFNLLKIIDNRDFLDAFLCIYLRKISIEIDTSVDIVKYENFIKNPEVTLKKLFNKLSIEWDPSILVAHNHYKVGEIGHGGIELWQPINGKKAANLPSALSDEEMSRIYGCCSALMYKLNYSIKDGKLVF